MGMDLVARRSGAGELHLNWQTHSTIGRCLDQLGADLTEWSGSNDGDPVSSATCRAWAALLSAAMAAGRIRVGLIEGPRGVRRSLVVPGAPVRPGSLAESLDMIDTATGRGAPQDDMSTAELDEAGAATVRRFIDFMETCGGCRQR